jgi:hypothetical protein
MIAFFQMGDAGLAIHLSNPVPVPLPFVAADG